MIYKSIIFQLSVFAFILGCSVDKNYSLEYSLLNTWSDSIKKKDYSLYKKIEAFPKNQDQFNEMYRDYYPSNITIIDVKESNESKKDLSGKRYIQKEVVVAGDIVVRKDNRLNPFKGKFYIIKYDDDLNWLVSGRILLRSD